jgi:hypothetical protein
MADVPLLRAVSQSHHSQDGEILDFTLQFADGSATRFEVPASDFTIAMTIFVQCLISARKAHRAQGKIDTGGAPPSDVVVIDPKRLGLIIGPERLPYLVVYMSNEPPLGIRLTVEDAQRLAGAFQRFLQGRAPGDASRVKRPRKLPNCNYRDRGGGATNRHLMGFSLPITVPPKEPEEAPSPPSGLLRVHAWARPPYVRLWH